MIYLRESKIFEWQVPQPINRFIGRDFPGAHLFKKFAYGFRVHEIALVFCTQVSIADGLLAFVRRIAVLRVG